MQNSAHRKGCGHLKPTIAVLFLTLLITGGLHARACASDAPSEATVIRQTAEAYLRGFSEEALLYESRDLRAGTVLDPGIVLSPEDEFRTYRISGKDVTLAQLRENIVYTEKKAAYYAGVRQMQDIYREGLRLTYACPELTIEGGVCTLKMTETAEFCYTDTVLPSVNEAYYTVTLVKLDNRWLIADITDGGTLDTQYKKNRSSFDPDAALTEQSWRLEAENCRITFPYQGSTAPDRIYYDGASAAAYACTYTRRRGTDEDSDYYNPFFPSYAGQGGDCMNFGSQCIWAGFGGSETAGAISSHRLPMDVSGNFAWYGKAAGSGGTSSSWVSCRAFRAYLTGTADAAGYGGSNAAGDTGIYATILDVGDSASLTGVQPEELVGAIAHVDGVGGDYSHTIVITAAAGNRRSQIWFCGHTKNVANMKLGDYYTCPMKVYIPRYMRTGTPQANTIQPKRIPPAAAGGTGLLGAQTQAPQYRMWLQVTAPDGGSVQTGLTEDGNVCQAEYTFNQPGLYKVECFAMAKPDSTAASVTYYVCCFVPEEITPVLVPDEPVPPEPEEIEDWPAGWLPDGI